MKLCEQLSNPWFVILNSGIVNYFMLQFDIIIIKINFEIKRDMKAL